MCPGGTLLTTWVSTGRTHHDHHGHTAAFIAPSYLGHENDVMFIRGIPESRLKREDFIFVILVRIRGPDAVSYTVLLFFDLIWLLSQSQAFSPANPRSQPYASRSEFTYSP